MNSIRTKAAATAAALGAALALDASAAFLDFENVPAGSTATSAAPSGFSFLPAAFLPLQDSFGDDIPGSERWIVDPSLPANTVKVEQPSLAGWGAAPSGVNALDARFQPVLLVFNSALNLASFQVTLDNSSFGNLPPSFLLFLDAAGGALGQISVDQTQAGYIASLSSPLDNVKSVLLAGGAYYDNLEVVATPLPATLALFAPALAGMGFAARRKGVKPV